MPKKKTNEEFLQELNAINNSITVLDDYINVGTKINFQCKVCNNIWKTTPGKILYYKHGCPKCGYAKMGKARRTSNEDFVKKLKEVNPTITPIDEYSTVISKINFLCNKCNHIFSASPNSALSGHGCPFCKESKGENKCKKYFNEKNIKYIPQYEFEDLLGINNGKLKFDFAIFVSSMMLLVEYDGEFHYQNIYDENKYNTLKIHDNIKNEYCINHSFPLLRIPYWEFDNIENILENFIKMCNELKGNKQFATIYLGEDVRSSTSKMFANLFQE